MSSAGNVAAIVKGKNLTSAERRAVIAELLTGSQNGVPIKDDLSRVAEVLSLENCDSTSAEDVLSRL